MQHDAIVANGKIHRTSPVDLRELPPVAVATEDQVRAAVVRARAAQPAWAAMSFNARAKLLKKACRQMLERRQQVVDVMLDEVGKHPAEVLMSEALGPLDYLSNWINVVRPAIRARKLGISPLAFPGKRGYVEMAPRGVVGIIAPWNFPLAYFFKPVFPALLCGDTVVIKPSEYAPKMAEWFVGVLNEYLPRDVLHCVHGDGVVGRHLALAGVDSLVFTGSIKTGREVLKLAAEQMIPCSVELGGKDPAIVLADCNLERTVAGVLHWGISNAGQSCGAIERVYVLPEIADRFARALGDAASRLKAEPAHDLMVDVGPIATSKQLAIIEDHVNDAVRKGAKVLAGGKRTGHGRWFAPTVLDHCDHTMKVVTDETFGPVIPIVRVKSVDEAVRLANDSIYGLNASVWSENLRAAEKIAHRLEAGTVLVNNHAVTGAMPTVPWTGVKQSGYGVANSSFALSTFVRPQSFVIDKNKQPDAWWFPINADLADMGERLAEAQLGRVWKAITIPVLMQKRTRAILDFVKPRESSESGPSNANGSGHGPSRGSNGMHGGHSVGQARGANAAGGTTTALDAAVERVLAMVANPTDIEKAWARSILETMYPGGVDPRITDGAGDLDIESFIQAMSSGMPAISTIGLRAAIVMVALAPVVTERRMVTFPSLTPDQRLRVLQAVGGSDNYFVRSLVTLIKATGALAYASASRLRPGGRARARVAVVGLRPEA